MNRGLNKVMLIGIVSRDPEMRYTPSGKPVTTFPLAISRTWSTTEGEKRTETERFNIVAWGNLAEICNQHLEKNCPVYIEGRLQSRRWEDKDGVQHNSVEIVANEMLVLGEQRRDWNNPQSEIEFTNQNLDDLSY